METPKYLSADDWGAPITYTWEPDKQVLLADKAPRNLQKSIAALSLRASMVVAIGCAEWVTERLRGRSQDRSADWYIEAMWAATINSKYVRTYRASPPDDDGDPVTGPLAGIQYELDAAISKCRTNHPERANAVARVGTVARYTLHETGHFDTWLRDVLLRFGTSFPYDAQALPGEFVPRKFLDPDVHIDTASVPRLLDEQLRDIDYKDNPFLKSPAELLAEGFEGEPYRFLR